MSDSVDRVFVHALATVRRLPRTGSSRPPPYARLQLYGLYKQSMEGDVSAILPRPTLPPPSPEPANSNNPSVHRYASRDLRTREAQAEIEKWDAWHACAGMSRTEAKRRYITTLISTMKEYASGTSESRELISELEFVWNQIRSQSGSDESEEGESPTRKLERAGLKRMTSDQSSSGAGGGGINNGRRGQGGSSIFGRVDSSNNSSRRDLFRPSQNQTQGLRVLSPISQRSTDDIVENEEEAYASATEENNDKEESNLLIPRAATTGPQPAPSHRRTESTAHWRSQVESHLRQLSTELAALREQLSSSHMLSRASFSVPTHLPLRLRIMYRTSIWVRWLFWTSLRQLGIQLALLLVVVVVGRLRGDRSSRRAETWLRERLGRLFFWVRLVASRGEIAGKDR